MMGFFLANPWGLLALLGLPVVLAIHLLRRKSREVVVSTLFLVEQALPSSEGGRRIRRLRNSLPLWLQLLAVCALAWLLAQPRWIDETSTQTVVAVIDSSASMEAFRDKTLQSVAQELGRLSSASARTQWIVLGSDGVRLSGGTDLPLVLSEVSAKWQPLLGTHDHTDAVRLARTLAGEKGTVLYVTDHPLSDAGVDWVSIGEPVANAGFLGAQATAAGWSALVRNFSESPKDVRWRVEGSENWQTLRLKENALQEITGEWAPKQDRIVLELAEDALAIDNRLPIIRPITKSLGVFSAKAETYQPLFAQLQKLAEPAVPMSLGTADVSLETYNPMTPTSPAGAAVVFVENSAEGQKLLSGGIVAENDPLMDHLNWQGLSVRQGPGVPFVEGDTGLLWQAGRPLIFLRSKNGRRQLIFNFDPRQSNVARLPAFALLVHRFFNSLRDEKQAYSAANVETRQRISVAGADPVVAPSRPDFFAIKNAGETVIYDGAAQFSDSRESDFRTAATNRHGDGGLEAIRQRNAQGAFLDPLWAFLLGGLMVWNWWLTGGARKRGPASGEMPEGSALKVGS